MRTTFRHKDADIEVRKLISGKNQITVKLLNKDLFMPYGMCETTYSADLIGLILDVKGPAWLCDEIMRDESLDYVQENLRYDLFSYISEEEFKDKRLLEFGCGSGASTMVLGRMLPSTEIVGVELNDKLLSIGRLRAKHYGFDKVTFLLSRSADELPSDIGEFDYVILNAVFEHLLPVERKTLLPQMWALLRPNGILFVTETPYRYFPIEFHTTGLPLINYLPDKTAFFYARTFSWRNLKNDTWEDMQRKGIRGASIGEIFKSLDDGMHKCKPILLEPSRLGMKDRFDIWYKQMDGYFRRSSQKRLSIVSLEFMGRMLLLSSKLLNILTGVRFLSRLSVAIKKSPSSGAS